MKILCIFDDTLCLNGRGFHFCGYQNYPRSSSRSNMGLKRKLSIKMDKTCQQDDCNNSNFVLSNTKYLINQLLVIQGHIWVSRWRGECVVHGKAAPHLSPWRFCCDNLELKLICVCNEYLCFRTWGFHIWGCRKSSRSFSRSNNDLKCFCG